MDGAGPQRGVRGVRDMPTEKLLRELSQKPNQAILNQLAFEPSYPRRISEMLEIPETEVARRLRRMERLGLVSGDWAYVGKNVKLYKLMVDRLEVRLGHEGVKIDLHGPDGDRPAVVREAFTMHVPTAEGFVGRATETQALGGPEPVVVLQGLPGVGKTALAAHYARENAGDRRVFWHSFRGVESLAWLAGRVGAFLAQNGEKDMLSAVRVANEPAELRELLWSGMDRPDLLLVLDDLHRVDDDAVQEFLAETPSRIQNSKLILTSREGPVHLPKPGRVRVLHLEGLDDAAMQALCKAKGLTVPKALVPRLRDEVGGHPMALNLFIETVKELDVDPEELLDRIPERNLEEYLLREVHEALGDDERRILALASLFRGAFTATDLGALASRSVQGPLLKVRRRLLVQALEGGFALHEVVRNFFQQFLDDPEKMHERLADHFLKKRTIEGRLEAYHHLNEAGRRDRILHLIEEDFDLHEFEALDSGYQDLYMKVLDLFDRKDVDDPRRWAIIEDERGDILLNRGQAKKALARYDTAVKIFEESDRDVDRLADLAWKRAMALEQLDQADKALAACRAALKLDRIPKRQRRRLEELRDRLEPDGA